MTNDDQPAPEDERSYAVGYGKPPKHSRFKPGQSGNPKGKKKGSKSFKTIVNSVLNEKVDVKTSRGTKKMSKMEAFVHTTMNDALKGDPKAADRVIKMTRDAGIVDELGDALNAEKMQQLSEEDHAILKRFGANNQRDEPDKVE